jgi:hypothetical protein
MGLYDCEGPLAVDLLTTNEGFEMLDYPLELLRGKRCDDKNRRRDTLRISTSSEQGIRVVEPHRTEMTMKSYHLTISASEEEFLTPFCSMNKVFVISRMEGILCSLSWTASGDGTLMIFLTPVQSISVNFKEWLERFPWCVEIIRVFKVWPFMKITKILWRLFDKE